MRGETVRPIVQRGAACFKSNPPARVVDAIAQAARRVLLNPDFQARTLNPFGFVAVGSDAATFADYIRRALPVQKKRIEAGGISLEM